MITNKPLLHKKAIDYWETAVTNSDHFNKWGQHYLPSLARAHQQQICNNFRDL